MFKQEEWEAASECKFQFTQVFDEYGVYETIVKRIGETLKKMRKNSPNNEIRGYAMAVAVLTCFGLNAEYDEYCIPSTRDCCKAYRKVKRLIGKGKPVYVPVWYGDDYYYNTVRVA